MLKHSSSFTPMYRATLKQYFLQIFSVKWNVPNISERSKKTNRRLVVSARFLETIISSS